MNRTIVAGIALAVALSATGCTPQPAERETGDVVTSSASDDEAVTIIESDRSDTMTSASLFDSAPLVIVGDAQLTAASTAVALGVPLLSIPTDSAGFDALDAELDRLDSTSVVEMGPTGALDDLESDGRRVIRLPDAASVADAFGLEVERPDPELTESASIAALEPHGDVVLGAPAVSPSASAPPVPLPDLRPGRVLNDTVAIVDDDPVHLPAAATARAAGAEVLVLPAEVSDVLASEATVDALAASAPARVIAIGDDLAADPSLQWKVDVSVSGARLPGGGVSWFPDHTLVAIYGVPGSGSLGILGEQDAAASVARAQSVAAPYDPLTDTTVVPTFEIITTVAAGGPGADGDFSNEVPVETIAPWVQAAADAGMQVILDLQPGRTDFLTQAKRYEELLRLPNVGLALDPEWRLAPDQVPLAQIGAVDAGEVNAVITWLADLTRDQSLPQKPLVLHQFRASMIGNRASLDTSRAEVAVLIHADGQGGQPDKQATWNALHADAPAGVSWGWKNFYDEDLPPLTPEQTMTQVVPAPSMISYQ